MVKENGEFAVFRKLQYRVHTVFTELNKSKMAKGTSGNVSAQDPKTGLIAITPSAVPYQKLRPRDICVITPAGKVVFGFRKPSSETPMHTAVYRIRPDVKGIVHSHSLYATVLSVLNRPLPAVTVPLAAIGPVPVAPFRLPGSQELADEVVSGLGDWGKAVLMQNHGLLCACASVEEALECAIYVEEGAQVAYFALLAGGLNPIAHEHAVVLRAATEKGKAF